MAHAQNLDQPRPNPHLPGMPPLPSPTRVLHPEIDHTNGVVRKARRDLVASGIPTDVGNASHAFIRPYQSAVLVITLHCIPHQRDGGREGGKEGGRARKGEGDKGSEINIAA